MLLADIYNGGKRKRERIKFSIHWGGIKCLHR